MKGFFNKYIDNFIVLIFLFIVLFFISSFLAVYSDEISMHVTQHGENDSFFLEIFFQFVIGIVALVFGLFRYRKHWYKFLLLFAVVVALLIYYYFTFSKISFFLSRKVILFFYNIDIGPYYGP
jgi:cell division protein FtsW (lipid II flippase)